MWRRNLDFAAINDIHSIKRQMDSGGNDAIAALHALKAMHDAGVVVDLRRMSSLTHGFASNWPLGGASASAMAEIISALRAHLCYL